MFKKIQFFLATIICITMLPTNAVYFINQTDRRIEFWNVKYKNESPYKSGKDLRLLYHILDPEWGIKELDIPDIKSFNVMCTPGKQRYYFRNVKDKTQIILHADLTFTINESVCSSVQ